MKEEKRNKHYINRKKYTNEIFTSLIRRFTFEKFGPNNYPK